jgi:hypothetical protein
VRVSVWGCVLLSSMVYLRRKMTSTSWNRCSGTRPPAPHRDSCIWYTSGLTSRRRRRNIRKLGVMKRPIPILKVCNWLNWYVGLLHTIVMSESVSNTALRSLTHHDCARIALDLPGHLPVSGDPGLSSFCLSAANRLVIERERP